MNDSMYIAATGMHMQQKSVDTIANNLANVNTAGFKKGRVNFGDLVYRTASSGANQGDAGAASTIWGGSGVGISSIAKIFGQGELKKTELPLDIAINGVGFFEVSGGDGRTAYTRGGSFIVDSDGFLASAEGHQLKPPIHIGLDAQTVTIKPDGTVMVQSAGQSGPTEAGRIELARFADTGGLIALGSNLYQPSAISGDAVYGRAGEDGLGSIAQGFVEGSNVKLIEEMVDLMVAQRAYESNVKVIQASDEMLAMSNNLRK